jgi:hypothetical protein
MSAVQAFEGWKRRIPLIADDVSYRAPQFSHVSSVSVKRGRLCVGAEFTWHDERVVVTSMKDETVDDKRVTTAIACSYVDGGGYPRKIKRRYTITREASIADRKRRKESREGRTNETN